MDRELILRVRTGSHYRLLAASDIHAYLSVFREALSKAAYRPGEDYLIIVGDMIQKGPENAATLDYMMELSQTPRVHLLRGNVDMTARVLVSDLSEPELLRFNEKWPRNLFTEWAAALGFEQVTADNCAEVRAAVASRYQAQLDFIDSLPIAIETDDLIFAHAGLDDLPDWRDSDPAHVLRADSFFDRSHRAPKPVVVGHWPVFNYAESGASCLPVISREKRIIAIDGGCGVKRVGQINIFIAEACGGTPAFDAVFADPHPKIQAVYTVQAEKPPLFKLNFMQPYVDLLEKGPFFSLCRAKHDGTRGLFKNEHISFSKTGEACVHSSLSNMLSVRKGDTVSLIDGDCAGFALARSETGEIGWLPKSALSLL